jgi:NADPH:quinone reductase-like Zn-dependent oxidoreductase
MTVHVMRSGVIGAPVEAVWHLLRDFNSHAGWHPAVAESSIEAGEAADLVGAVRAFSLRDGSFLREQLIALSDREKTLTYCILESPIPLHGYVAQMQLRPVTDGNACFLLWESRFNPPPGQADALLRLVAENIYEAGIAALRTHFHQPALADATPPRGAVSPMPASGTSARAPMQPAASPAAMAGATGNVRCTAIGVGQYGGPEVLVPCEIEVPPPGPGQVRLRQTVIGVNFIDIYCRRGDFSLLDLPGIPGMEGVGVVTDIGPDVGTYRVGDRVAYAGLPIGAYAAIRNLPADLLVPVPDDLDDRIVAASYLKGATVDFLLHDIHPVTPGQPILLRAAAGGLGLLLSQAAKAAGAVVIGVVSNDMKAAVARRAGCDHVIVDAGRGSGGLVPQVMELTAKRGVEVVYDGGGGATFDESLACLAICGHLVSLGQASGAIGPRDIDALVAKSATVSRPNFAHYNADAVTRRARAGRLFAALRQKRLVPHIAGELPLSAAAEAHRGLEHRDNIGTYLLVP